MKKYIAIILCLLSNLSHSQNIPINGVLGLACGDSLQNLDYWEAKNVYDFSYEKLKNNEEINTNLNYTLIFEKRIKQYATLDTGFLSAMVLMSSWILPMQVLVKKEIEFTENLQIKDREITTVEFYPPNCNLEYIGYSIALPHTNLDNLDYKFFIKKEAWAKLDYANKVFTVSHFVFGARIDMDFEDAEHLEFKKMRFYNSLLLSDQLYNISEEEFEELTNLN